MNKMLIANPIYDVVFKYLLDDNKCARLLISEIIGEKIKKLVFRTTEEKIDIENRIIVIYRLDFSALIETEAGETKQVLIEIQKAKYATDIIRFRKYLGQQYIKSDLVTESPGKYLPIPKYPPIICIYFLGHKLKNVKVPIVEVKRNYYNVATGKVIHTKEEFIESLTHDSFVIQIPRLAKKNKTELENLLSIFELGNRLTFSHELEVNVADYPEKYRMLIRRLQRANAEPKVRRTMDIEDEILAEFEKKDREILFHVEEINEKNQLINEKQQIIQEKEKVINEKDAVINEKEHVIENQSKAIQAKDKLIENMLKISKSRRRKRSNKSSF